MSKWYECNKEAGFGISKVYVIKGKSYFLDVILTVGNPKISLSVTLAILSSFFKGGKGLHP